MKYLFILSLFLMPLLESCGSKNKKINEEKEWRESGYQLTQLRRFHHKGLNVYFPSYFMKDYGREHLQKKNGLAMFSSLLSLYVSVEHFSPKEAELFKMNYPDSETTMEAVQSNYLNRRIDMLYLHSLSVSNDMPTKSKLDGYYHVLEGTSSAYSDELMYFIATVEKKIGGESHYYVVQMVSPPDVASYVMDDYRRMLRGCH